MFKHPLFLKIILIFTLPALGILYFSTVLVYDKIKFLENYENETITVEKRNWYFIGINKNIIAFRFIRNIRVDEHLFGANISIKATGGWVEAKYLSKNDAETFKNSLFEYNKGRNNYIIFS